MSQQSSFLTVLPVFNEVATVDEVLDLVVKYADDVLVVDDGSTDGTSDLLAKRQDVKLLPHGVNKGYGAALITGFQFAADNGYEFVVTIDCDGQHEPQRIRDFVARIESSDADIVSGSRYLEEFGADTSAPAERQKINQIITKTIGDCMDIELTDAFCGFKAYRVESLKKLELTETGYAMPLELWVQAACQELKVVEVAVPRIYLDENRSFGEELDNADSRLEYYRSVINAALKRLPGGCDKLREQRVG
ncbi:glycosyltransferase family 2 protein [Mariniblastus fucicola]|uniref:Undecaprenyl-phosphate mannosyltransferase n=1 Tax=Mariniblastus fucicola TaxID=980251 RepID=A0A5B9PNE1_9BACT|nr:glycosyltransferase family 2 protein [Mariniblastus fucicola]QEG24061.1 Undecaprenyl-phosphate mannosyltransferase [Mariniblastus fucicola]